MRKPTHRRALARFYASAVGPVDFEGIGEAMKLAEQAAKRSRSIKALGWEVRAESDELSIYDELVPGFFDMKGFMAAIAEREGQPITVSILSPGGDAFMGLALFNALARHDGEVTVRVEGIAASAASLVAMAGDRIVMPENSFLMIHRPFALVIGTADELQANAERLTRVQDAYTATYIARSGADRERIEALMRDESYISASEAVEIGLADEVETRMQFAASLDLDRLPGEPPSALAESFEPTGGPEDDPEPDPEGDPEGDPEPEPEDDPEPEAEDDLTPVRIAASGKKKGKGREMAASGSREREIAELCEIAGRPEKACELIRSDKTVKEVRAELREATRPGPSPDDRRDDPPRARAPKRINHSALMARWNGQKKEG